MPMPEPKAELAQLEAENQLLKANLRKAQKVTEEWRSRALQDQSTRDQASPSRERLDFLLSHLPVVYWAVNSRGQISQFQGAGLEKLGLAGGEVYGQSIVEAFGDNPHIADCLKRALAGEALTESIELDQHVFQCQFSPQWNAEKDVIGVRGVAVVWPISESSGSDATNEWSPSAELPPINRLNEKEGPLQSLFRSLPDFVLMVSEDGTIQFINRTIPPAKPEDVIGTNISGFVHEDSRESVEQCLKKAFARGEVIECETKSYDPDGKVRNYAGRIGPYRPAVDVESPESSAEVRSVMIIARDVTALREAEELARVRGNEIEHLARTATMGEMASIVAHYLNNPLAAISNYAHGCIRRLNNENNDEINHSEFVDALTEIVAQCNRSSDYIRQLRGFLQKREAQFEQLDLIEIIENAIHLTDAEIRSHKIAIERQYPETRPMVFGDALQLEQLISNLLLNAVDSMTPPIGSSAGSVGDESDSLGKNRIWIRVEEQSSDAVTVSIRDFGGGLTRSVQEKMFEPFFTTRAKRLGMGLSVVRTILDSHGGQLEVSTDVGTGTTFRFTLGQRASGKSG